MGTHNWPEVAIRVAALADKIAQERVNEIAATAQRYQHPQQQYSPDICPVQYREGFSPHYRWCAYTRRYGGKVSSSHNVVYSFRTRADREAYLWWLGRRGVHFDVLAKYYIKAGWRNRDG